MDWLFIVAVCELTLFSLLALFLKSKLKIILALLAGVIISWYIGVAKVEMFNEAAFLEYQEGLQGKFPSDGASNVFSLYFGWIPGLIYSGVFYGAGKVLMKIFMLKQNENT